MDTPRNRIKEMIEVRAADLLDHDGNWRTHPLYQREALKGILAEVGMTDALKAYYSPRHGGRLTLLDGHLRKADNPDATWPVLVLDLGDEEADKLLAFFDSIGGWAQTNPVRLDQLLERARINDGRLQEAAERLRLSLADQVRIAREALEGGDGADADGRHERLSAERGRAVKVVVPIGDELGTFEKALKATGLPNRGEALVAVCNYYLDNHASK